MTTSTTLVPVEKDTAVDLVKRQVEEAERQADLIEVTSPEQDALATAYLQEIARREKAAEEKRKELVGPLNKTVKLINKEFKDAAAPFQAAGQKVRAKVTAFRAERERIRQEEEARLEAERLERERKIREERERQESEARAKQEQADREAREAEEEARKAKDEEDRKVAEQLAAEVREKAQEAQTAASAISALPEVSLPKAVVEQAPTPAGSSTPKHWTVKVTDPSKVDRRWLVVDEAALRKHMFEILKETGKPPIEDGVEFEQVSGLAVRT